MCLVECFCICAGHGSCPAPLGAGTGGAGGAELCPRSTGRAESRSAAGCAAASRHGGDLKKSLAGSLGFCLGIWKGFALKGSGGDVPQSWARGISTACPSTASTPGVFSIWDLPRAQHPGDPAAPLCARVLLLCTAGMLC